MLTKTKLIEQIENLPEEFSIDELVEKLTLIDKSNKPTKQSRLTELLLHGPVFTEEQIKTIEETRTSINQWRAKP